jgi:hypothetical protein
MNPALISAGFTAANLFGHVARETTMNIEETPHELGPEHAGFRAEHESMKAGILGLGITIAITTGFMAYFVSRNEKDHEKLQDELDVIWAEVSGRREPVDQLAELPTLPSVR